jgi:Ser/Thr protein kinase RdoA (MazF antagonist)
MFAFEGHASDTPDYMAVDEDRRLVSAVYAETREILAALSRNPDSWGLIHGDLYHWNVLFEGDQVNVIDFDDTQWGFWLADLATALADVMSSETYEDVRASLLAGYEEVSPLPPRTNELLDIFLQARLASVAAWVMSRTAIPAFRESGHEWVASLCRRIRRLR